MSVRLRYHDQQNIRFVNFLNLLLLKFIICSLADVGSKTTTGIAGKVTDFMPTPMGILTLSKEALLGVPVELLMTCMDRLCKHLT